MTIEKESGLLPGSLRVLDLTDRKGFLCGKILGDLGADVIKLEPPGGDPSRNIGPFYHDIPESDKSLSWFAFNTSKRGITLNIETADGREIFKRLASKSDIVIESFHPGYMETLGLGYSALSAINPGLIMTSIAPFGQTGPYRDYKISDLVAVAMGGFLYICGDPDRAPVRCSAEQAFCQAGAQAAMATMIAHYHRELTGEGQWVDVSIQESVVPSTWFAQQLWDLNRAVLMRQGRWFTLGNGLKKQFIFACKDGYVCWMIFSGAWGRRTRILVEWMDSEGMAGELLSVDWESLDLDAVSQEEITAWEAAFQKFFLTHTMAELYAASTDRGVLLFPVNDVKEIFEDDQLKAREFWEEVKHPELETSIVYPGAPFKLSEPLWKISRCAPLVGEHNEEIYITELGFSKDELSILKQATVI